MTPEQLQAHQNAMAVQRERFQRFWYDLLDVFELRGIRFTDEEKAGLMHKAWLLWRELKEG